MTSFGPGGASVRAGLQYFLGGGGPLAKSINHGGGFFRTRPDLDRPNMQLYFQAFSTLIPRDGERPMLTPTPGRACRSACRTAARPAGAISGCGVADPGDHPVITANAFSTNNDVEEMLAAVKFVRQIAAQPALARLIKEELRPGPRGATDEALIADFRARSGTVYHPSCTCRMGQDAAMSVVDAGLRVHGVGGLRVIDASAFPNIIAGNTNAPAILMGWKGAEAVLADAR